MKSRITKLAAITMGPLVALALYGGIARSASNCVPANQDAFFYAAHLKIVKGATTGTDAFTFLGNLVNEDPTAECFSGLDPVNGCGGVDEQTDDFVIGGEPVTFVLNNAASCNLNASPPNYFIFTVPKFEKVNNTYAFFKGSVVGSLDGSPATVKVNAQVWRVGAQTPPNYNYTDDTCGNFRFAIQVLGLDLQGHSLAANPLTLNVLFGDEVTVPGVQSFGCFQTNSAQICTYAAGRDAANDAACNSAIPKP
jgi:hypothetical protein